MCKILQRRVVLRKSVSKLSGRPLLLKKIVKSAMDGRFAGSARMRRYKRIYNFVKELIESLRFLMLASVAFNYAGFAR